MSFSIINKDGCFTRVRLTIYGEQMSLLLLVREIISKNRFCDSGILSGSCWSPPPVLHACLGERVGPRSPCTTALASSYRTSSVSLTITQLSSVFLLAATSLRSGSSDPFRRPSELMLAKLAWSFDQNLYDFHMHAREKTTTMLSIRVANHSL